MLAVQQRFFVPENTEEEEPPIFDSEPTMLRQSDFEHGTLRITESGLYVLAEDIVFEPVDFTPSTSKYSDRYTGGAYHLGFFAAITVEAANVVLDLAGHTLSQSRLHNLEQRFFALIELADQPFLPKQGPSDFGADIVAASNVWILNGVLGKSSHHSIHGNSNKTVRVRNVCMEDFEVAGLALNGCSDVVVEQCRVGPSSQEVPVSANYSQSRFLLPVLKQVDGWREVRPGVTVASVTSELEERLNATRTKVMAGEEVTDPLFSLPNGLTDGAVVGIQIHPPGIAIKGFQKDWTRGRQENIVVRNCHVIGLNSMSQEAVALNKLNVEDTTQYPTKKVQSGVFGAVLRFDRIVGESNEYVADPLTDGLFAVWKFLGKGNIDEAVYEWAANGTPLPGEFYPVLAGDSMHHLMKGNIGIFLSGCYRFVVENVSIEGVLNQGAMSAVQVPGAQFHTDMNMPRYNGNMCRGVMLATCHQGMLRGVSVRDLFTMQQPVGIESFGPTQDVVVVNPSIQLNRGIAMLGGGMVQKGEKRAMHWVS